MLTPPPPPKPDSRQHPRYDLYASVEITNGEDETLVLPARNVSLGGIYLAADGNRLNHFNVGDKVHVMVFDAMDEAQPPIHADAEVMRNEGQGIGLGWSTDDEVLAAKVSALIARIAPK